MADHTLPLLQMQDITKSFFGVRVLHNVNFDLRHGEVHVLLGENGAGKSTLMKILSAAYQADSGHIFIEGQEVHFRHPHEAQDAGISTIYQHFSQAPHLTVAENIFLGHPPRTRTGLINWRQMRRGAQAALANVGADLDPDIPVGKLSVASRQIVEIASALNRKVRILIMDEPTAALTEHEVEHLFGLIRSLRTHGVGVVYISHRLEELHSLGNRVTVLRDGHNMGTFDVDKVDVNTLVNTMIGRELQQISIAPLIANTPEVLRVENLTKHGKYKSVSFSVRQGEILGISGLMGAGRTEVAQAIFGASLAKLRIDLSTWETGIDPAAGRRPAPGDWLPDRRPHRQRVGHGVEYSRKYDAADVGQRSGLPVWLSVEPPTGTPTDR